MMLQLNKLDELRLNVYENAKLIQGGDQAMA